MKRSTRFSIKKVFRTASGVLLGLIAFSSVFSSWVAPYPYDEQNIEERLLPPSSSHLMGTDFLGRDLFSRIIQGGRASLAVGLVTAFFALIVGTFFGVLAGFFGGWVDSWIMRLSDLFYTIPSTLVAILLLLVMGKGIMGILLAIALTTWTLQARVTRNIILRTRSLPFVESARALGLGNLQILFRHLLPHLLGPTFVTLAFQIPNNIMAESFLSFIGLGLQPPETSWGTLASEGFKSLQSDPHLIIFPGGILFLTMMALNLLSEALREKMDKSLTSAAKSGFLS